MAFDSLDAFLAMGGHGPYVWACYLVFFGLSFVLIGWSKKQHKAVLQGLARRQAVPDKSKTGTATADFTRVDSSIH